MGGMLPGERTGSGSSNRAFTAANEAYTNALSALGATVDRPSQTAGRPSAGSDAFGCLRQVGKACCVLREGGTCTVLCQSCTWPHPPPPIVCSYRGLHVALPQVLLRMGVDEVMLMGDVDAQLKTQLARSLSGRATPSNAVSQGSKHSHLVHSVLSTPTAPSTTATTRRYPMPITTATAYTSSGSGFGMLTATPFTPTQNQWATARPPTCSPSLSYSRAHARW